jgi:hypothetical protein
MEGLTFCINKKDIITEEVDTPTNPNPYEDTEQSDDFLKYIQQRDKIRALQRKKDLKDIRITGERSGYEGVISERTPAEDELASYLVKPKKSKTNEPLSVLDVLERLPINEADRKSEISQLKQSYKEQQLEDAPDKELVKELVKLIPELSVPKKVGDLVRISPQLSKEPVAFVARLQPPAIRKRKPELKAQMTKLTEEIQTARQEAKAKKRYKLNPNELQKKLEALTESEELIKILPERFSYAPLEL